jgi:hypothetical protein
MILFLAVSTLFAACYLLYVLLLSGPGPLRRRALAAPAQQCRRCGCPGREGTDRAGRPIYVCMVCRGPSWERAL